ncbi:MAG: hypothetical protein MHM6MM_007120 [Cercozoa sp. M6MM]
MDVRKDEVMQVAMAAMHMYVANRGGIKMPAPLHHASRWIKDDGTFSQVFKCNSTPLHGGVYCLSQTELSLRYRVSVCTSICLAQVESSKHAFTASLPLNANR